MVEGVNDDGGVGEEEDEWVLTPKHNTLELEKVLIPNWTAKLHT
jgi:hypothetical protein